MGEAFLGLGLKFYPPPTGRRTGETVNVRMEDHLPFMACIHGLGTIPSCTYIDVPERKRKERKVPYCKQQDSMCVLNRVYTSK